MDIMEGIISYSGVLELQYGLKLMQARTKYIVHDMMPSDHLSTRSKYYYLQFVRLGRILC